MYRRNSLLAALDFAAFLLLVTSVSAQNPSPALHRMTVMIQGLNGRPSGAGFIIGDDKDLIYIVTAEHVVTTSGKLTVELHRALGGGNKLNCSAFAFAMSSTGMDAAILKCLKVPGTRYHFAYDIVGEPTELRSSAPLMLIGNLPDLLNTQSNEGNSKGWNVPDGYFLFDRLFPKKNPKDIEFLNLRRYDLQGASGGPLLTDRSELLGMVYNEREQSDVSVKALAWFAIRQWAESTGAKIRLTKQGRSAAPLRRNNVELSAEAASTYVSNFGWLPLAPKFRIGSSLPNFPLIGVSFDFTYSKGMRAPHGVTESVGLIVPSFNAEVQLGSIWGPTRRRGLLSGLYVAAGVAPMILERSLSGSLVQDNIHNWTGIFDVGWRYRLPGRPWGITTSYGEGIVFGESSQNPYPRFRAVSCGLFVVFK
jgi:hypothetical protein